MNFGLPCLHFEYMQLYLSQQFVIAQQLSQPGDFVGFAIIRLEHIATDNLVFYRQGITVCVIMKICWKKVIFFFFFEKYDITLYSLKEQIDIKIFAAFVRLYFLF